ncbi:related to Autophagy-related protein 22 [Saccharomycodes ludwigii]|uniref:Autophagy-related protein n=2 Tax=Saccharomycodes ludwigii TaxID=36035 RepID=A0A376B968_9ASCO|nr:related to Autophagy-related protein 22 [Saccharomycodes ludwigii]
MAKTYVPVVIQDITYTLGHPKKLPNKKCEQFGSDCYFEFNGHLVQATAYVTYLKAIYTSLEGLVAIVLMGIADFSNYRKWLMCVSIALFSMICFILLGVAWEQTYGRLVGSSILYVVMLICDTIYQITQGSYIPVFMKAKYDEVQNCNSMLKTGATVSAMGIIASNLGGILGLIIGVVIVYTHRVVSTYRNYLIAIIIGGGISLFCVSIGSFFLPNFKGEKFQYSIKKNGSLQVVSYPFKRFTRILKDIYQYKEAFKYVVGWVLWNISYSNFLFIFGLLFRTTLGLGKSASEYTIFQFVSYIAASLGSFGWMLAYRNWNGSHKASTKLIKYTLYFLLTIGLFSNIWGSIGASSSSGIGFKHGWEFWLFQIFFTSSSSAIRSLNRAVYSALLPTGKENEYFGLEVMLGLATGWCESLIIAEIQNNTGNLRVPFIPNLCLFAISIFFFWWTDLDKGMKQVGKLEKTALDPLTSETGEII